MSVTSVVICIFLLVYLHLLNHPSYPVVTMPSTALDRIFPLVPEALFVYMSLWLYVGAGPGLQLHFIELVNYTAWAILLCVAGLVIFYFWPTQVPAHGHDLSPYFGFAMLQGIDAAGNACPSMHVAFSSFTVIRVENVLRVVGAPRSIRAVNMAWFLAIVFSTLAIRQHVVLDVLAGLALGTTLAAASLRWGFTLPGSHPTNTRT
ncbi:MAG: phosphatase PAP2 family protein [Burkholderiaceae bacterium]|nr:phosphatase PAP2 family protein [Burkholderiaceae bacterium]